MQNSARCLTLLTLCPDLEQPSEAGVPVGHMLRRALGSMGQAADDQAQCAEGLVDLDALLELLTHGTRRLLILTT